MEPCPYCGSPVRSGARFCTSCGRRLTPGANEGPAAGDGAIGFGDREAAPSAWESATPVAEHAERSVGGGSWLGRSPVASADLWPSAKRGPEAAPEADDQTERERAVAASRSGVEPDPEVAVAWPSAPWSGWAMPDPVETQDSGTVMRDNPPVETKAADEAVEEPVQSTETADEEEQDAPLAVPDRPLGSVGEAVPAAGDPLGRAMGLVDELRGLLPAIAGASGVDLAGAIAALTAARDEAANLDGEALARAEEAVSSARERPGDVHALLGLSGSLEALAGVLRIHGRYAAALDQAIGYLAGGGGGDPPLAPVAAAGPMATSSN